MDKRKSSYSLMVRKTLGEMQNHSIIWSGNPVITNTLAEINTTLADIETTNARKNQTTVGISKTKQDFRTQVDEITEIFLGIFRSYAKTVKNNDLFQSSKKSLSEIRYIKDSEIMVLINLTLSYANNNIALLTDYGMNPQLITDYTQAADGFKTYLTKPQEIKAEKKTATAQLNQLFKHLDELISEYLDNHMMQYKKSEPLFYSDYENARIIYDDPTISKSLMGTIVDAGNHALLLQYVKVTVKFTDSMHVEQTKTTSKKGNFQFKGLPEGKCTVTFQKNYYDTLTVNSEIHNNAMTRLNVELTKTQ